VRIQFPTFSDFPFESITHDQQDLERK